MASVAKATTQTTNAYRRPIGDFEVTALLDGYVELSNKVWAGVTSEQVDAALTKRGLRTGGMRNGITSFLINTGKKMVMIDAGAAGLFGPHSHTFPRNLEGVGVRREQVDEVLVTHAHPDHVGALALEGGKGGPTLPNAVIRISKRELEFWTSRAEQAKAPEWMRSWWDAVIAVFDCYAGRIETFEPGAVVGDGIRSVGQPGHTPGHVGYMVENGGSRIYFWGDMVVGAAIQLPHPEAAMIFDIDIEEGKRSRMKGIEWAATERVLCAGTHLPFPTFGYVRRSGGAYEWVAEEWKYDVADRPLSPIV